MNIIFFDNGGTLINDPFQDVLELLYKDLSKGAIGNILRKSDKIKLFNYWREENFTIDFPFASHFLQEETWIINALLRLHKESGIPNLVDIPYISLNILHRYRVLAKEHIKAQQQLAKYRRIFAKLKKVELLICVASNDREFATKCMLEWAELKQYIDHIFTSEGLSKKYQGAEKPSNIFFDAIVRETGIDKKKIDNLIYVGDSEENDIGPLLASNFTTIRFFNPLNPSDATWLDHDMKTSANFHFSEIDQLYGILQKIMKGGRG